jgi:hypothetical protein
MASRKDDGGGIREAAKQFTSLAAAAVVALGAAIGVGVLETDQRQSLTCGELLDWVGERDYVLQEGAAATDVTPVEPGRRTHVPA